MIFFRCMVAFVGLMSFGRIAWGDAPKRALSLGVEINGVMLEKAYWKKDISSSIEGTLKRANYTVKSISGSAEENLHEAVTLDKVAKANSADFVVAVRIGNDMQRPPSYLITVSAVRADAIAPFRQKESLCRCSEFEAKEKVLALLAEVMEQNPASVQVNPNPTEVRPSLVASPSTTSSRKQKAWLAVGGVGVALAVAGAVGLGVSIPLNGRTTCDASFPSNRLCPREQDTTPAIAISAVGLGIGAVLAPLGFVMAKRKSNTLAFQPWVGSNLGLTLLGAF